MDVKNFLYCSIHDCDTWYRPVIISSCIDLLNECVNVIPAHCDDMTLMTLMTEIDVYTTLLQPLVVDHLVKLICYSQS